MNVRVLPSLKTFDTFLNTVCISSVVRQTKLLFLTVNEVKDDMK